MRRDCGVNPGNSPKSVRPAHEGTDASKGETFPNKSCLIFDRSDRSDEGDSRTIRPLEPQLTRSFRSLGERNRSPRCSLEHFSKVLDRVDPMLAVEPQSLQNRRQIGRDRTLRPGTDRSTRPIQQTQILFNRNRQHSPIRRPYHPRTQTPKF
jgi:hypothetical protein